MLNRKTTAPNVRAQPPPRWKTSSKAKTAPVRRRFVIASSARRIFPKSPEANWQIQTYGQFHRRGGKLRPTATANAAAPAPPQSTVDLTETIKTLLHLAQEHGYVTYDDINDVLPDNLSPDDLDALLSKLRSLDVEIVMDQAEAERPNAPSSPNTRSRRKPTRTRVWKFWTTRSGCI